MKGTPKPKLYKPLHKVIKVKATVLKGNEGRQKLYDATWEKYREDFLSHNRKCYACGEFATVVDHLRPHKGDIELFWKVDNFIPLCKYHHDKVTGLFDMRFTIGSSLEPKIKFLNGYRFMNDLTFKVKVVPFSEEIMDRILKLKEQAKKER